MSPEDDRKEWGGVGGLRRNKMVSRHSEKF